MTDDRVEREAKLQVADLAPIRERLRELAATYAGAVQQHDTLYDFPDARLEKAGAALRLRRAAGRGALTYKGPPRPGPFKQRNEYETAVADPEAVALLFESIGLHVTLSYAKRRESWKFKGCEVCLDELPLLGCFVEIEGADHAEIEHVARELRLDPRAHISASYPQLLAEACTRQNLDPTNLHGH